MISNIQILRGLAAVLVVVFHASLEVTGRVGNTAFPELLIGAFGVDLFFAISGFLMVLTTRSAIGGPGTALRFAKHRIVRIVPLYWIVTITSILYQVIANRHSILLDDLAVHTFCSLSFIPCSRQNLPIVIQGWTLNYEMAFYGLFAVALLWRPRAALVVLAIVLTAVALGASTGWVVHSVYEANGLLFEFVLGMAAGHVFLRCPEPRRFRNLAAVVLVGSCIAAGLGTLAYPRWFAWRGLLWGVPAAAIVGSASFLDRGPAAAEAPIRRAFERLGDASYSLYLIHLLVFRIFSRVALPLLFSGKAGAWLYAALGILAAISGALIVYRYVEGPIAASLRSGPQPSALRFRFRTSRD